MSSRNIQTLGEQINKPRLTLALRKRKTENIQSPVSSPLGSDDWMEGKDCLLFFLYHVARILFPMTSGGNKQGSIFGLHVHSLAFVV